MSIALFQYDVPGEKLEVRATMTGDVELTATCGGDITQVVTVHIQACDVPWVAPGIDRALKAAVATGGHVDLVGTANGKPAPALIQAICDAIPTDAIDDPYEAEALARFVARGLAARYDLTEKTGATA